MRRIAVAGVLAVPLGLLLGAAGQTADHLLHELRWAAALGAPWLAVAFLAGALARDRIAAAVAGAVALVVATVTYYAVNRAGGGLAGSAVIVVGWSAACVLAGGGFALAGAAWRTGGSLGRPAGAAVLAGALVGEAVLLASEWPDRAVQVVLTTELAAGAALPFLLARGRAVPAALLLTAVCAVALGTAEAEVRDALRAVGWRGL